MSESTSISTPTVEMRPGGRGGLLQSGNPGNRGGFGVASELRRKLTGSFEHRVKVAEEICDNEKVSSKDRLRALDLLGKYGPGVNTGIPTEEVRDKVKATLQAIRDNVNPELADQLIAAIRPIWA